VLALLLAFNPHMRVNVPGMGAYLASISILEVPVLLYGVVMAAILTRRRLLPFWSAAGLSILVAFSVFVPLGNWDFLHVDFSIPMLPGVAICIVLPALGSLWVARLYLRVAPRPSA